MSRSYQFRGSIVNQTHRLGGHCSWTVKKYLPVFRHNHSHGVTSAAMWNAYPGEDCQADCVGRGSRMGASHLPDGRLADLPCGTAQVGGVSVGDNKVLTHPSCLYAEQKHLSTRGKRLSRTQVCIRSGRYGGRGPSKACLEGALRDSVVLLTLNTLHSWLHDKRFASQVRSNHCA